MILRRKLLVFVLIAAVAVCFIPLSDSYASSTKQKKKELKEVQSQKDDISEELSVMEGKIAKSEAALAELQADIEKKEGQLAKTEKELADTKKKIEDRQDGLNKRLRTMYKSGTIGYIDVILGSNSVEELVTNVDLVQKIFSNDQEILTELKAQKVEIDEKEAKLQVEKAELDEQKSVRDAEQATLEEQQAKLQAKYDSLAETEAKLKKAIEEAQNNGGIVYAGAKWVFPLHDGYTMTSHYGEARSYESHPGVDLACPTGTKVYAAQSGKVITAGWYGGYGNAVVIYHGNNVSSVYGHNSSLAVSAGQTVKRGQLIAYVGSTGWSTGSHLHFEVRVNGSPVSPQPYIGIS